MRRKTTPSTEKDLSTQEQIVLNDPKFKNRVYVPVMIFAVIILLATASFEGYKRHQEYSFKNQVPTEIRNAIDFPIYIPQGLPEGFTFSKKSVNSTSQVFSFVVEYEKNKKLIFTEQPKPTGIDTDTFAKERLYGSKSLTLPVGKGAIGSINGKTTASVTTDETWILITAPDGITEKDLRAVLRQLKLI